VAVVRPLARWHVVAVAGQVQRVHSAIYIFTKLVGFTASNNMQAAADEIIAILHGIFVYIFLFFKNIYYQYFVK
jgi:hypothetical protein